MPDIIERPVSHERVRDMIAAAAGNAMQLEQLCYALARSLDRRDERIRVLEARADVWFRMASQNAQGNA